MAIAREETVGRPTLVMKAAEPDSDRELVRAMARGNAHALDVLYARHGRAILAYLTDQLSDRQLAEEVLQDVMLAAWQGAGRFRGESKVKTWLLGIAHYRMLNARRKRRRLEAPLDNRVVGGSDTAPLTAERQDIEADVQSVLQRLSPDLRATLELTFYHGLSGPEVATVLGVAPGTVKSRLHRAKAILRRHLSAKEWVDV
jgi:RNA polymerase sigma-70 factor (ECF subfamily)